MDRVIPFLREALDPDARLRDDVVASALLALGKSARDPSAIPPLRRWLEDARASNLVRESAALSIGLLRRDREEERFPGPLCDGLRGVLLDVLDDRKTPARTRAFAAMSIGLLGDQPFGDAFTRDGRAILRALWDRLGDASTDVDTSIALLTALGMQPPAGVAEGVREALHAVVMGKRMRGRGWNAMERSHALTALARWGGPGCDGLLVRILTRRREDVAVKRAAFLALGARASLMGNEDRADAMAAVLRAVGDARDPLTTGLAHVALGRLAGADLRADSPPRPVASAAHAFLVAEARSGSTPTRGFSAIALALASRDVEVSCREVAARLVAAERALTEGFVDRGDPTVRAACAVALGLLGATNPVGPLRDVVGDRDAPYALRGHAAVALGQIGRRTPETVRALRLLLAERRSEEIRREAALALSLLGDPTAAPQLVREMKTGSTERLLAQVAVALGRLDDLAAVGPLLEMARDATRTELTQALAVVSLGLLADPLARPSLLRLTQDANYPARTDALHEVFTIL